MKKIAYCALLIICIFAKSSFCYGTENQGQSAVLFDAGHGQKFLIDDKTPLGLSRFAEVFSKNGFTVENFSTSLDNHVLQDKDVLVIAGPFVPYSPEEIGAIQKFLINGGHLCLLLHVAPPVNGLLHQLGINPASGIVHENENILQNNPLNFKATNLASHPLHQNLRHINFYGAWGFRSSLEDTRVIARTSPQAWIDLNLNTKVEPEAELYPYGLIIVGKIGKGRFVVFSDDAIFQNKFLQNENSILARNLVQWLAQ